MFASVFNDTNRFCDYQKSDLEHVIHHVFYPVNAPVYSHRSDSEDAAMQLSAQTACVAVYAYCDHIEDFRKPQWDQIVQMLRSFRHGHRSEEYFFKLRGMKPGGTSLRLILDTFLRAHR